MATIFNAKLTISHDHDKKLAYPVVKCNINFNGLEYCQMQTCVESTLFKLKCQLWGADEFLTGADDLLYTYPTVHFYPDADPARTESAKFEAILGEGVLDEDWGVDEIYGKLILVNLLTMKPITKKTNVVSHSF